MNAVELTAHDRCDVNRVEQARVRWTKDGVGELVFCHHHSEKFGAELTAQGFKAVADNRHELTKRAVGAEVS